MRPAAEPKGKLKKLLVVMSGFRPTATAGKAGGAGVHATTGRSFTLEGVVLAQS